MAAVVEFQIPLCREDLTQRGERRQYVVTERYTANELVPRLDECRRRFGAQGPHAVQEYFDVFYSQLRQFNSVCVSVREGYWEIALNALRDQCNSLGGLDLDRLSRERKAKERNTLKMLLYIVVQLVEGFESEATKPDMLAAGGQKRSKGGKKSVATQSSVGLNWPSEREAVMDVLCQLAELDPPLWDPPTPRMTEDCCNLMASCCYKMLENPTIGREKALREKIAHLLGTIVKKYNQSLGVSLRIIQLLQHFEHLVSPLAQLVSSIATASEARSIVADVIREIGSKDPHDLVKDTSGTRCFASFIVELAQSQAGAILPTISVLLPHLSGESYTMRNGVLGVIGEALSQILSSPEIDEQARVARDQLLDKLEEHIHDISAHVRSKTLQIWVQLANAKAIPLRKQREVLGLVVGRVKDKSSLVRKSAVHLLTAFLTGNPFSSKLDEAEFQAKLTAEETKLRSMLPPEVDMLQGKDGGVAMTQQEYEQAGELDVARQMAMVQYFRDGLSFIQMMSRCIPVTVQLLGSKVISDVLESLEFLASAYEFSVWGSQRGVRKALVLVWSKEQQVREAVVAVYVRLYINPQVDDPRRRMSAIVRNLITLTEGASCGDLTSLEEMVSLLVTGKHLTPAIIRTLWDTFTGKVPGASGQDSRAALRLLSMAGNADREILKSNVDILVAHGLKSASGGSTDLVMAKLACIALQKVAVAKTAKGGIAEKAQRLPSSHIMFREIISILVDTDSNLDSSQWCPFAGQAISTIYKLSEQPDALCESVLRALSERALAGHASATKEPGAEPLEESEAEPLTSQINSDLLAPSCLSFDSAPDSSEPLATSSQGIPLPSSSDPDCPPALSRPGDPTLLTRLLFAVGQVAQCQIIHLETSITNELKRRRHQAQEGGADSTLRPAGTPRTNSKGKTPKKAGGSTDFPSIEEEMGLAGAAADDAEAELMRRVCETEVCGAGMLTVFEPLIVAVVTSPSKYPCPSLQASASLALAKFMLISAPMCEKYLQLLFTILEKSPEAVIRANTVIALGDLTVRYPNLTEPWTPFLYSRLRDPSPAVRKNTLVVLTHLILNDMIKVKGQISELALCLEDSEQHISDSTRLFFFELSRKGNALYNVLPDIISHLSDPDNPVPQETFRSVVKYLFSFIQKDKHCESLVEKLCHRFRATRTERQWHDLAHCLAQINFTDRCVRKLQDNFACYQDKLADPEVFAALTSILNKAKKFAKPDTRAAVEELERKVGEAHRKGLEEEEPTSSQVPGGTDTAPPDGCELAASQQEEAGEGEREKGGQQDGEGGEGGLLPDRGQNSDRGDEEQDGMKENTPVKEVSISPPPPPSARSRRAKTAVKSTAKRSQRPFSTRNPLTETSNRPVVPPPPQSPLPENTLRLSDVDFQTDVLSSARRVPLSSIRRTRPPPSSRKRRVVKKVVYSDSSDEEEEERRVWSGRGRKRVQQMDSSDDMD